ALAVEGDSAEQRQVISVVSVVSSVVSVVLNLFGNRQGRTKKIQTQRTQRKTLRTRRGRRKRMKTLLFAALSAAAPAVPAPPECPATAEPMNHQPWMNVFRRYDVDDEKEFAFYKDVLGLEQLGTFANVGAGGVHRFRAGAGELKLTRRVPERA